MTLMYAQDYMTGFDRSDVLVVDDDPFIRKTSQRYLAAEGRDCTVYSEPFAAVELILSQPMRFGLVLMDIRYPQGNLGLTATERLFEGLGKQGLQPESYPVVIGMTAHLSTCEGIDWRACGMAEVIPKPLFKWLVVNLANTHCD